jgi:hypothetical protein
MAISARFPLPADSSSVDDPTQPIESAELQQQRDDRSPSRRPPVRASLRFDRRLVMVLAVLLVGGWVSVSLADAVGTARRLRAEAADLRAQADLLRTQLASGQAEIRLIESDAFLTLEVRAYGLGGRGERAFGLAPGAPSPRPITPLGGEPAPLPAHDPIEELTDLLLGR